ncbi:MAG: DUF4388 domain-containing protein [Cyanobacteria bacterium J06639_14]
MEITGNFSEFPLPELLQFLDRRRATGCLSLHVFSNHYAELKPRQYDVWLHRGQIVSVQQGNCKQDVYDLAVEKRWMSLFAARKLKQRSPQGVAAGLYLESQGVINFEQLRSLFFGEVVHRVEALCATQNAVFKFQSTTIPPSHSMTGLSISAARVAKQGFSNTGRNCSIALRNKLVKAS